MEKMVCCVQEFQKGYFEFLVWDNFANKAKNSQ